MDPESIALARAVGEQVLRDEHSFFVDEETDNSEHVPRVARIAESVRCALEQAGCDALQGGVGPDYLHSSILLRMRALASSCGIPSPAASCASARAMSSSSAKR